MEKMLLVLIDGNAILHRSYHATPRFQVDGRLVNAIYGFISTLFSTIEKFEPTHLAVAFDVKGPTFRDEIFDQYKAKRVKPPQEFYDQIPHVWKFVEKMSIPLLSKQGYEADDLIGTIVKKINGDFKEGEIIIVTGDQDALQLVDKRTRVAMSAMGKIKETVYDQTAVLGKFGFEPSRIVDYKALSGDSSDNIPGVAGIGQVTAKALINHYGSLEKIYEALGDEEEFKKNFKKSVFDKLQNGRQDAFMSYKLATIKTDVELDFLISCAKTHDFDKDEVIEFLQEFKFKSLIKRLPESRRGAIKQESLF